MMQPSDETTLTVGGAALAGWTDVRVTRRIEGCPNDFDLGLTEAYPGQPTEIQVKAGDPCIVMIGSDKVITGYIDRVSRAYDKGSHTVTVSGRGKTQDLVDCSAEWPGGQISGNNVQEIADKLCQPYGIEANGIGDPGPAIPQFNLTLGETAYDIIERICRYTGLLAYEDPEGNLVLASGQDVPAESDFEEGVNVQAAHAMDAMDGRFSEIDCFLLGMDVTGDAGSGGNLLGKATDPNVPRHRLQYIIAEAGGGGQDVCLKRALWEAARRAGRAQPVSLTCDSWRDSGGNLWAPNTQAAAHLPSLKISTTQFTVSQTVVAGGAAASLDSGRRIIGEVTYRKSAGTGTTCDVTLMPAAAYSPEPVLLQPQFLDVKPVAPRPA